MSSTSLKLYASPRYNIKVSWNLFKGLSKGVVITYLYWGRGGGDFRGECITNAILRRGF